MEFSQKYEEDYDETFIPKAKIKSVWVVIYLAVNLGWKLWQLDMKNVFLNGEIDNDIYIEQPPRYISISKPSYVCKL